MLRLTLHEHHILYALSEALYTETDARRRTWPQVFVEVEEWLSALDFVSLFALRAMLAAIELSPFRLGFGVRRMSALSVSDRARYLAILDRRGASMLILWKTLLGSAYFATPTGESELHLKDHHIAKQRIRRPPPRHSTRRLLPISSSVLAGTSEVKAGVL